ALRRVGAASARPRPRLLSGRSGVVALSHRAIHRAARRARHRCRVLAVPRRAAVRRALSSEKTAGAAAAARGAHAGAARRRIAPPAAGRGAETVRLQPIVDTRVYRPRHMPPPAVPVVGWIGTHGTYPFLERLLPLLDRLRRDVTFELVIIGSGRPADTRPWSM